MKRCRLKGAAAAGAFLVAAMVPVNAMAQCAELDLAAREVRDVSKRIAGSYNEKPVDGVVARTTAAQRAARSVQQEWETLFALSIADGVNARRALTEDAPIVPPTAEVQAEVAGRMGEAARTDQQLGAPASVSGSTSAIVKSAMPAILGIAVEHGAVQRKDNGTSTTLSTSPYALMLLGMRDSTHNFRKYGLWRRLGVSGTFDLDQSNSTSSDGLNADNLSAVTTQVRLWGDRSPRTEEFERVWKAQVEPQLQIAGDDLNALKVLVLRQPSLLHVSLAMRTSGSPFLNTLEQSLAAREVGTATDADVEGDLKRAICAHIVQPVRAGAIDVGDVVTSDVVQSASKSNASWANAVESLHKTVDDFNAQTPVFSVTHTWNRMDDGHDYSDLVLVADAAFGGESMPAFVVVLNASVGMNHETDDTLDQETVREYAISGSLEKAFQTPLRWGDLPDQSTRMLVQLIGRYARQKDADVDIGVIQGRLQVPLARGLSLVASVDYATETESNTGSEFRANGAIEMNGDTFAALGALGQMLSRK